MRYILYVFLGACSFGVLSTFAKLAYDEGYIVNEVVGSQMLCGWLILQGLQLFTKRQKLNFKQYAQLMGAGSMMGLTGVFYYTSLQTIPASIAIVLLFQFTWIGVVIEAIIKRQRPTWDQVLSLVILFLGTLLAGGILFSASNEPLQFNLMGVIWGLLSALSYALFIIFSGRVASNVPSLQRSTIITTGGMITAFIIFPPTFIFDGTIFSSLSWYGLLMGILGPVIPTLLYTKGVPHIGGSLASILSAAELPVAVMMSSLVLAEHVSFFQWTGVVVILFGVALPELISLRKSHTLASS
jgi:drug/metabolite transporter (DMT)-like permease